MSQGKKKSVAHDMSVCVRARVCRSVSGKVRTWCIDRFACGYDPRIKIHSRDCLAMDIAARHQQQFLEDYDIRGTGPEPREDDQIFLCHIYDCRMFLLTLSFLQWLAPRQPWTTCPLVFLIYSNFAIRRWENRTIDWTEEEIRLFYEVAQNSKEWHDLRGLVQGASKLPALIALDEYALPRDHIRHTLGMYLTMEEPVDPLSPAELGHEREPVAAWLTEYKFPDIGPLKETGITVSNKHPRLRKLGISADRIGKKMFKSQMRTLVIEIKCLSHGVVGASASKWKSEAEARLYVPATKIIQVYAQMAVTDAPQAYLVSFYPGKDESFTGARLRVHHFIRDDRFWDTEVVPRILKGFEALENFDLNYTPEPWPKGPRFDEHNVLSHVPREVILDEYLDPALVREAYASVYGPDFKPKFLRKTSEAC